MSAAGQDAPALGMLQLMNRPVSLPGALGDPATFDFPVRYRQVPGAWTDSVVGEGAEIEAAYVEAARRMAAEGVAAVSTNCGFTARFQPAVAAAVPVPVGLSSLLLVPLVTGMLAPGARLGVVTYDAARLTETHFRGAGWSRDALPVEVVGIEGSESWHEMARPEPRLTAAMLTRDVIAAVRGLRAAHPEVSALVLECSAFPVATAAVRREFGLPAVDFSTLQRFLMAGVSPRAGRSRPRDDAKGPLALLRLQHDPIELPGSIAVPESFAYPVRYRPVPGAWTTNVTRGERGVVSAYIDCAAEMAAEGCAAVITTCGFTSLYQAEIAAAVPVPFLGSSLFLVPLVRAMLPSEAKVALLTYDASCLSEAHCAAAGFSLTDGDVVVAGTDGTESWRQLRAEHPDIGPGQLAADVFAAYDRLAAAHPEVRAIVLECAIFPIVADALRARAGLPVHDFLSLADLVMEAAPPRREIARAAAE